MGENDVGADELPAAGHVMLDERPMVGQELQVEIRDSAARIALAGRGRGDRPLPAGESEIAGLDRRQERWTVDFVVGIAAENRVALKLRQPQRTG
jgi:hypothetical protein